MCPYSLSTNCLMSFAMFLHSHSVLHSQLVICRIHFFPLHQHMKHTDFWDCSWSLEMVRPSASTARESPLLLPKLLLGANCSSILIFRPYVLHLWSKSVYWPCCFARAASWCVLHQKQRCKPTLSRYRWLSAAKTLQLEPTASKKVHRQLPGWKNIFHEIYLYT